MVAKTVFLKVFERVALLDCTAADKRVVSTERAQVVAMVV
jgi:hypothetical protein